MTHAEAFAVIREHGGEPAEHVSRATTLVVIGEEGWPLEADGRVSVKLQEAEALRAAGSGLRLASESEFLRMVGLADDEAQPRLYTPAMLSRLLGLSPNLVRRWERLGVLRPVKKVGRLPYFTFREVTRLRRISELLAAGVPRSQLEQSLRQLTDLTGGTSDGGAESPSRDATSRDATSTTATHSETGEKETGERDDFDGLAQQLELLAGSQLLVRRDERGLIDVGSQQRVFDFGGIAEDDDSPAATVPFRQRADRSQPRSALEWYELACDHYEASELTAAERAFREATRQRPEQPEFHFHLAETLFRLGEADRALERYFAATEWDPEYIEAWGQIGVLHLDRHEADEARAALLKAIDLDDDFADGHFHLGETMVELGDLAAARRHLRRYLALESSGPWAELARQKLTLIESLPGHE